ncbi:hypothetical protein [Chryseobacterium sp. JV274]|uniref:hypothetical protein n=1 Tax=Chryseobacterium sp. JV274 TaxID=1932669 RepID=UPI0009854167|nr:hypothetical protein [Chryseobacterium sp. JV274]
MKKKVILVGMMMFSLYSYSQVGINNQSPKSTLDITAKNATGTSALPEGLLIPRVSREKAQSMSNVEHSTLIYISDITTGGQLGTTVDVDSIGFYYYNSDTSKWVKFGSGSNVIPNFEVKGLTGLSSGNFDFSFNNNRAGINYFEFVANSGALNFPPAANFKDRIIYLRNISSTTFQFNFQETYQTNQIALDLFPSRSLAFGSDGIRWYSLAGF